MISPRPTLYRDAALADPTGPSLRTGVSLLADASRVVWIRPSTDEGDLPPSVDVIDAGGSAIVPGMVDAHSHVTLPGGSHWIVLAPRPRPHRSTAPLGRTCTGATSRDRRRTKRPGRRKTFGPSSNSRTVARRRSPLIPASLSVPGSGSTPESIRSNTDSS